MGSVPAVRGTVALVIGALVFASCGGGDDESTSSTTQASSTATPSSTSSATTTTDSTSEKQPADDPRDSLTAVLVDGDCTSAVTGHFIQVAYGSEQACKQSTQAGGTADSIEVRSVNTHGDTAKATVVPDGGPSSGDKLTVTLVKDGNVWKVDALKSNVAVGP
jgi:hypothetical protein